MPDAQPASEGILLHEETVASAWNLQGPDDDPGLAAAVRECCGLDLPRAHRTAGRDGRAAIWLGPDSWLIAAVTADATTWFAAARDAIELAGGALFDVSASRVIIRIAGAQAARVVAKGCSIDLDPRAFAAGECRATLLARIAAIIVKHDETPAFSVFAPRSYAESIWHWMKVSAAQYGCSVGPAQPFVLGATPFVRGDLVPQ